MTVEQFQAERREVQDETITDLEPAVRDGLEQRDGGAEDWVAPIVAAVVSAYLARREAEAPGVRIPAAVLSEFREQIRATLELTEPSDNADAQVDRLATWLGVAATNAATLDAFDATEDDGSVLVWQTMRDGDVRSMHRRVQGQRRPLGQPFDVGGHQLAYPGQPVGPPEVWINCRCALRRRSAEEEAVTASMTAAVDEYTAPEWAGGMVALKPADPESLAVEGGDPASELHVTVLFLADDLSEHPPEALEAAQRAGSSGTRYLPITARVAGVGRLGDADPPAAVLFLNGEGLTGVREQGVAALAEWDEGPPFFARQHEPWIAHMTLGYGLDPNDYQDMVGTEIVLDRVDVHVGGDVTTYPTEQEEALTAAAASMPWHAILAPEGAWSGDGRRFLTEGLTNRDLPLPLLWQRETGDGHQNSVVVGRIDSIRRDGEMVRAAGVFRDTEEADEVIGMIAGGFLRGVSVDVDRAQMELVDDGEEEGVDITGRIAAATLVPIPAFQEAFIALGPEMIAVEGVEAADDSENDDDCPEGEHMMPGGWCMPDDEMSGRSAEFAISEADWDGDASRFTDDEWYRSTIVHTNGDSRVKSDNKLPIREPNGDLSRAGVHAAAARINQTEASDEQIASAKRALRSAYNELDEDPPEVIEAAMQFQPEGDPTRGPGWVTHPEETNRLHNYWTRGPGAAEIGWGTPGDFNRCRRALAEYIEARHLNSTCAEWHNDALGFWPGEHNGEESALQKGQSMSLLASAAEAALPTSAWFGDQKLTGPTALTVTDCGQVFGHLALWGTCHIGVQGECMTPPTSASNYAYFATGMRRTEDGEVPVGQITLGTGHAKDGLSPAATLAHYDNTGTAVADVVAGEDQYGIWVSGALRDIDDGIVDTLRAATLSGDWRRIRGSYELVGALGVNVPGFPVPRTRAGFEAGEQVSLVAAGVIKPAEGQEAVQMTPQNMYRHLKVIEDRERQRAELEQSMRSLRADELVAELGR